MKRRSGCCAVAIYCIAALTSFSDSISYIPYLFSEWRISKFIYFICFSKTSYLVSVHKPNTAFGYNPKVPSIQRIPGDFRSWESPQTLSALFAGYFEHAERFRNLKFTVKRITNIQSTLLSSSDGTAAIHPAFK